VKMDWLNEAIGNISQDSILAAISRQNQLTKPRGSLGRLEETAIQLAGMQHTDRPTINNIHIAVFAADHGIAEESVSAFPQSVSVEMVRNFANGGAAISVLAKEIKAKLEVVNVGTITDPGYLAGVTSKRISAGTANFSKQAAMSDNQLMEAMLIGRDTIQSAHINQLSLFIGGEMGIGNTTSAAAISCALLSEPPEAVVGPGTGLDKTGIAHKSLIIKNALELHQAHFNTPLEILRRLGGFEIAALTGAYIRCAQMGIPVLVDGFIGSVAALIAVRHHASVRKWLLFSHASAEPGHAKVLASLNAIPLLDLTMRLGEGSGAAVAVPLLHLACALHNQMATFSEANVSEANDSKPKVSEANDSQVKASEATAAKDRPE